MPKMLLIPDADGYSSADGVEVIKTDLDGGPSRYRQDKIGAPKTVQVKWTMNPAQYQYWRAFFVTATKRGALPFTCDLLSEDGTGAVEHVCNFVPGSINLPAQLGLTYVQSASLEVKPLAHNAVLDAGILLAFETWGEGAFSVLGALAHLINDIAPDVGA